jgi:dipeptidyl aminopeptidase/acylaminoacyl peptidase
MKRFWLFLPLFSLTTGCADEAPKLVTPPKKAVPNQAAAPSTLTDARRGFVTRLGPDQDREGPPDQPPPNVFKLVRYKAPVGDLAAYLTPDPGDGVKHPAIIWITGGDCNSIGDVWKEAPRKNDQTASAYRKAGIVLMMPSLRGGNDNPGRREGFFGEIDDVLAAAEYLAAQPYVDPGRIYLGGHSTGGTLAMLVAESTDRFRAVFAFGPTNDVRGYGGNFVYHAPGNPKEDELRSPGFWLSSVKSPLFVIEGVNGNAAPLLAMKSASKNPLIRFALVPDYDHFGILAPANEKIAAKILADTGQAMAISVSEAELRP